MLDSTLAPENSLTEYNGAASANSFLFACIWWPVGFALATFYSVFISRRYAEKVSVREVYWNSGKINSKYRVRGTELLIFEKDRKD